jgi:signal transduction histidine kinase/CheY-like chemotaxis protein
METIFARTRAGEAISGLETTQQRKDGSSFHSAVWTAPFKDASGSVSGILVTLADVSDRQLLEERLRVSQKMEAVGRLAGGIAHDFNNLLTVINGYSMMLVETLKGDPYPRSQAEEVLNAGNRAASLVAQLLTFSRHQVVAPKPVDLNQLVRELWRMLRRLIGEHIRVNTILNENVGWTVVDRNQMETTLINLATNAQDAMPGGGTLTIETARIEAVPGERSPEPDLPPGSYVRLIVRDTGHGMDAQTQQHLFEPFFTTKEVGKGTGLGLSSVYAGVQKAHGRIFVASELGKGTTFSIYLPRCEQPVSVGSPSTPTAGKTRLTGAVLLVEDESAVRRVLREALSHAGYRVLEAGNGREALELWGGDPGQFDLVVTDVVMPEMNGVSLTEELKKRRPGLKVIFMSGHTEDIVARQNNEEQSFEFLQKPFPPDELARRVRDILGDSKSVRHRQ